MSDYSILAIPLACAFLLWLVRKHPSRIQCSIVMFMAILPAFAAKLQPFMGYNVTVGMGIYTAIIFAQAMLLGAGRRRMAVETVAFGSIALAFGTLLFWLGWKLYTPDTLTAMIKTGVDIRIAMTAPCIIAYALSAPVMLFVFDLTHKRPLWLQVLAAVTVGQAVSTFVFYGAAYGPSTSVSELTDNSIAAFGLKMALSVALIPLAYSTRRAVIKQDQGCVLCG